MICFLSLADLCDPAFPGAEIVKTLLMRLFVRRWPAGGLENGWRWENSVRRHHCGWKGGFVHGRPHGEPGRKERPLFSVKGQKGTAWADFIRNVTQQFALNLDTVVSLSSPSVHGRAHQRLDQGTGWRGGLAGPGASRRLRVNSSAAASPARVPVTPRVSGRLGWKNHRLLEPKEPEAWRLLGNLGLCHDSLVGVGDQRALGPLLRVKRGSWAHLPKAVFWLLREQAPGICHLRC